MTSHRGVNTIAVQEHGTWPRGDVKPPLLDSILKRACALLSALLLSGCAVHDSPKPPGPGVAPDGRQEIVGTLDVTGKEAAVVDAGQRVLLVADPPQTALGLDTMLAKTAGALRHFHGRRVRARGDRQGRVLWSVEVVDAMFERKVR